MSDGKIGRITIRKFTPADAPHCFRARCRAFLLQFAGELTPAEVAAGVCAYLPEDYIRMAEMMDVFIVEEAGQSAGFFSLRRVDAKTAEIPLLYLDRLAQGRGIGALCIQFIEDRIARELTSVDTLFIDTVVPRLNAGFYRKMGFVDSGSAVCRFPDLSLKAVRLTKGIARVA